MAPPPLPPALLPAETRRCAILFGVWLVPLLTWMLVFMVGGPAVVGQEVYAKMDVTRLNLGQFGLG